MVITQAYYYWAILEHKNWAKTPTGYSITLKQIIDFQTLLTRLIKNKSADEAVEKLPPYPLRNIDEEYWQDLVKTKELVDSIVSYGKEPIYYYGSLPQSSI